MCNFVFFSHAFRFLWATQVTPHSRSLFVPAPPDLQIKHWRIPYIPFHPPSSNLLSIFFHAFSIFAFPNVLWIVDFRAVLLLCHVVALHQRDFVWPIQNCKMLDEKKTLERFLTSHPLDFFLCVCHIERNVIHQVLERRNIPKEWKHQSHGKRKRLRISITLMLYHIFLIYYDTVKKKKKRRKMDGKLGTFQINFF